MPSTQQAKYSKLNVLVVDDEMLIRNMIELILKDMGFKRIVMAANGAAALEILMEPETSFDFIICDWMMPEMDGLELLRQLRAINCRSRFVMLTAKVDQTDVLDAKHEGVDGYISKPFAPLDIHKKIEALARGIAD